MRFRRSTYLACVVLSACARVVRRFTSSYPLPPFTGAVSLCGRFRLRPAFHSVGPAARAAVPPSVGRLP